MEKYAYDPIDLDGSAFRLLRLHQGTGSEISCEIFQALLHQRDDAVSYEALSYSWGTTEITESILVDGKRLGITLNLYLALQQLRRTDEDRILWADAICIDQSNTKERGHQVQQMGDIFKQADRVIFWLGQGSYQINVLMDSMRLLQRESNKQACKSWKREDERWKDLWVKVQLQLRNEHTNLENLQREGLNDLLGRPWFRRVWILQEVANAKAALVCCGAKSVYARLFSLAPILLGVSPNAHCQAVLDIMPGPWREASWWSQSPDLYALLKNFGGSEATDARDLVYALTGMSSDARDVPALRPDYEKSEENLARDAIQFMYYCEFDDMRDNMPSTIRDLTGRVVDLNTSICQALAQRSHRKGIEMLLKRPEAKIDQEVVKAAVLNDANGEVTEVLLRYRGHEFEVNHEVIMAAIQNRDGAKEVMEVLLLFREDDVDITETVLRDVAVNSTCGEKLMKLFLSRDSTDFDATNIAEAAAGNYRKAEEVIRLLFFQAGQRISITKELLTNAAKNEICGERVLDFLFQYRGDDICIQSETIEAAIQNTKTGLEILKLFIKYRPHDLAITDAVIRATVQSAQGEEAMRMLLQNQVPRDLEKELRTFVRWCNLRIMKLFLESRGSGVNITKPVAQAAGLNTKNGVLIIQELLREGEYGIVVDEDAAIELVNTLGIPTAEYLLLYRRDQVVKSDAILQAIFGRVISAVGEHIRNPPGLERVLELLRAEGINIDDQHDSEDDGQDSAVDPAAELIYDRIEKTKPINGRNGLRWSQKLSCFGCVRMLWCGSKMPGTEDGIATAAHRRKRDRIRSFFGMKRASQ